MEHVVVILKLLIYCTLYICHKIRSAHKQVILIALFSLYLCYLEQRCPLHALYFSPYTSLLINLTNIFYGSSH